MRDIAAAATLCVCCVLVGCRSTRPKVPAAGEVPAPTQEVAPVEPAPSPAPVEAVTVSNAGVAVEAPRHEHSSVGPQLGPGLLIAVRVLVAGKKEIDEPSKRISDSGEVSVPLVGSVPAAGMSLEDLASVLTTLYAQYFVQPQVVVEFVRDEDSDRILAWGYVTVLGRVKNPGRVSIPPTQDLTVSGAIQKAGGLDTSAKDSAIRVTRQLPNGKTKKFDVNLRRVGSAGTVKDDLTLRPGDVVFVPEMMF